MISAKGLNSSGVPELRIKATNKTGGALVIGGVYALDRRQANAASTDPDAAAANVVAVATANLNTSLVVATDTTANNADGLFVQASQDVQILVDGTTDVAAGDALVAQNASVNVIKQAAGSLTTACAMALEAQTADAGTLARCEFDGRAMWKAKAPVS